MKIRAILSTLSLLIVLLISAQINPENITIARDSWGIPYVYANTDPEIAYGLAWVQCEDEFENLQLGILFVKERLGRSYGPEGAAGDYFSALFRLENLVKQKKSELSPEFLAYIEGFCQGMNDYAASHPKEVIDKKAFPVTVEEMIEVYPLKLTQFMGAGNIVNRIVNGDYYDQKLTEVDYGSKGSNAFAFQSKMTKDGRTYLICNPHQPFTGPEHFYEVQLMSGSGWKFQGALFPGSLSPQIGTNGNLGWTHTNNYFDHTDVYALKMHPDRKLAYEYDGEWKELDERKIKLKVKLKFLPFRIGVKKKAYQSVYGPTLKSKSGNFYAIRTPPSMGITSSEQWYRMGKAQNLDEFKEALEIDGLPYFNITYADKDDNILYLFNGHFPVREEGYNWTGLVPGNTSQTLWDSFYPLASRPMIENPDCGYVYNVNHNPFKCTCEDEWLDSLNYDPNVNFMEVDDLMRSLQWREIYTDGSPVNMEELKELKYDSRVPEGSGWNTLLNKLRDANGNNLTGAIIKELNTWDATIDQESILPTYLLLSYFKLPKEIKSLDEMSPNQAQQTLLSAREHLLKYFGKAEVTFKEFFRFKRGKKDLPIFGFPNTLAARSGYLDKDNGRYYATGGDGFMMFIQFDKDGLVEMESIVAYGGTQNEDKPHYNNQMELFTKKGSKKQTFNKEEVLKNASRVYHPK